MFIMYFQALKAVLKWYALYDSTFVKKIDLHWNKDNYKTYFNTTCPWRMELKMILGARPLKPPGHNDLNKKIFFAELFKRPSVQISKTLLFCWYNENGGYL